MFGRHDKEAALSAKLISFDNVMDAFVQHHYFLWTNRNMRIAAAEVLRGKSVIVKGYTLTIEDAYHNSVPHPELAMALYHSSLKLLMQNMDATILTAPAAIPPTDYSQVIVMDLFCPVVISEDVHYHLDFLSSVIPTKTHHCTLSLYGTQFRRK